MRSAGSKPVLLTPPVDDVVDVEDFPEAERDGVASDPFDFGLARQLPDQRREAGRWPFDP
jgi:hypothetical protein